MKLDRTTYEAWLLDRLEGNLSAEQERELDAFLAANPDLLPDFDAEDVLPRIEAESIRFLDREALHRDLPPTGEVSQNTLDDHLVARLEGDLAPDQLAALGRYLADHPEASRDAFLIAATKVQATRMPFAEKPSVLRSFPPAGLPDAHRLDDFLVAHLEGQLTPAQEVAMDAFIASDPAHQRAARLMALARIEPGTVMFPDKARLHKQSGRVIALWPRLAAAVSIALLLGLAWWALDRPARTDPTERVAETGTHLVPQESADTLSQEAPATSSEPLHDHALAASKERHAAPAKVQDAGRILNDDQREPAQLTDQPVVPHMESPDVELPQMAEQPALQETTSPVATPEQPALAEATPQEKQPGMPALRNTQQERYTVGELVASTVRTGVLKQERQEPRPLDRRDAVDLADAGLKAVSGGRAGVSKEGHRLSIQLGNGFRVTASR